MVNEIANVDNNANSNFKGSIRMYPAFPIPSENEINIPFQISEKGAVHLKIYDIAGYVCFSRTIHFNSPGFHKTVIDDHRLKGGIYIIELEKNSEKIRRKIIIRK